MSHPLWYEKYRPKTLDEYVWIDAEFREKIARYLEEPGKTPHLCLVGHPGTGKTTLAKLIAASLTNEPGDVLFVNASKDNGADMIRNLVEPFCQTAGWSELRFVIFDESERLTRAAWEQLRGTMNTFGEHVRFFFTCNSSMQMKDYMDSRIRTIQFDALDRDSFMERILTILLAEEIELDDDALKLVQNRIDRYYPDMRKTIDMIEDSCIGNKLVDDKRKTIDDQPWLPGLLGHLRSGLNITLLRQQIADLSPEQLLEVYPALDQNSADLFGKDEGLAIMAIKQHMVEHSTAAFPGMIVLGLFIQLAYIRTGG